MGYFDLTWSLQTVKLTPPIIRDRSFVPKNGDFEMTEIDSDYIEYIICSSPGHWKEFPPVGVGVYRYLQGTESPQVLQRNIRLQLENDVFYKPVVDVSKFPIVVVNSVTLKLNAP